MKAFARVQRRRLAPALRRASAPPVRLAGRADQGMRALLAPAVGERPAARAAFTEPIRKAPSPEPAEKETGPAAREAPKASREEPKASKEEPKVSKEEPKASKEEPKPGAAQEKPAQAAEAPAFPTGPALETAAAASPAAAVAASAAPVKAEAAATVPAAKEEAKPAEKTPAAEARGPVEDKGREAAERRGLEELKEQVRGEAKKLRRHPAPAKKRAEATAASALSEPEQKEQSSKEKGTLALRDVAAEQLSRQGTRAQENAEAFKKAFKALLESQKAPQSEAEVKEYAEKPPVQGSTEALQADVKNKQSQIGEPLQRQLATLPQPDDPKKAAKLPPAPVPPPPAPLEARLAVPKPKEGIAGIIQRHRDRLENAMKKSRLTDRQLEQSREPQFLEALEAKRQAERKITEAPDAYRARESQTRQEAEGTAGEKLAAGLQGMGTVHSKAHAGVRGGQDQTESKTEKRQGEIKAKIEGIYGRAAGEVKKILDAMAPKATGEFTAALERQTRLFNERVRKRISSYYGRFRIDDKLFGPAPVVVNEKGETRPLTRDEIFGRKKPEGKLINPDVWRIFREERDSFLAGMDGELEKIAQSVGQSLSDAATEIEKGEREMDDFKRTLSGDELEYANELEEQVKLKFANLREGVDAAREDLLQALADQYSETVNQLETSFHDINDELKKSWLDRAVEFIETVGRTIFQLAELIVSILTRLAGLVWDIIQHPIRFFETLVGGLGQGISRFVDGFPVYLQEAFWSWLTGATPAKSIRLSSSSGVESLFDLVLQVLDLGPPALRAIVEKVFGKEFMARIDKVLALGEKALEPLAILLDKGPLALWEHLREQLGTLVQSTFERIKESVFFAFVEKALKWIAGFFVPGGGFVKVVKAIVRAFQFVADNLARLKHFFDSVFDSMEAAVEGRTDVVAGRIIQGLKMGIVLALDFLARQLDMGRIVDSVQKIIQSLRRPIVNAIEWLLRKIKPLVLKVAGAVVKAGEKVVAAGKKAVARVRNWWRARRGFTSEAGEPHSLYFEGGEANPRLMIKSEAQTYSDFIRTVKVPEDKQDEKAEAMKLAADLDREVARARAPGEASLAADPSAEIARLLDRLAAATARFYPVDTDKTSPTVYGPLVHGFGSSARVALLTKKHPTGSEPKVEGGHWDALRRRMHGGSTLYVRGHLLNEKLGGPGSWPNLTPLTQDANNRAATSMLHLFESKVKDKVEQGARVDFTVTASYGRSHGLASWIADLQASENPDDRTIGEIVRAEQYVPDKVVCESHEVTAKGAQGRRVAGPVEVDNTISGGRIDTTIDDYQLTAERVTAFYLDDAIRGENRRALARLDGTSSSVIEALIANRPPEGYRRVQQLTAHGLDWEKACATKGLRVRIYKRK